MPKYKNQYFTWHILYLHDMKEAKADIVLPMLFPDSPLASIQSQSVIEFNQIRESIPNETICAIPKSFCGRIFRLIPREVLMTKFTALKYLEDIQDDANEGNICVILPNDEEDANSAVNYLKKLPNYKIWILVTPRDGPFFSKVFENAFPGENLKIIEFHYDLLLLGENLFLTNAPRSFRHIFVDGDIDDLTAVARTLTKIQIINGTFGSLYCIGEYAMKVKKIVEEQKAQIGLTSFSNQSVYDTLIILDRTIDLVSPLLSQKTFAGAIDDFFNVDCGFLHLPDDIDINQSEYLLSDNDQAFKECSSLQIKNVPTYITSRIQQVKESIQNRRSGEIDMEFKQKISKAMAFVNSMPQFENMFKICDYVVKNRSSDPYFGDIIDFEASILRGDSAAPATAEANIIRDQNWTETVREFCLASLCLNGVPSTPFNGFITRMMQRFGMDIINDLVNLRNIGMLDMSHGLIQKVKDKIMHIRMANQNSTFDLYKEIPKELYIEGNAKDEAQKAEISRKLDEFMQKSFDEDIFEYFDGYAPFSARVVQCSIDHRLGRLERQKGRNIEQYMNENLIRFEIPPRKEEEVPETNRKILVFIIGGVSLSEVAAISNLGKKFWGGKSIDITVGSTSIVTGKRLIQEIVPKVAQADLEQPIVV